MSTLLNQLTAALKASDWPYVELDGGRGVRLGLQTERGVMEGVVTVYEDRKFLVCAAKAPVSAPPDKQAAVAELLNRINYALLIGNLEMDPRDGAIYTRTSVDVEFIEVSPPFISNLIMASFRILDMNIPALVNVVFNNMSPEEAFAKTQAPSQN
ncbi:YbjN domain-containing protein [Alicyclobacillus sp.]|uniref:YbjN domain-containing protein n=1 Tax=Alicyclobacillus sp. TaxID=61169 RepID=UPI0025BFD7AA|nr:YbjN domain-containing protein [Alicyclobacillus sp.]MCL6515341.1 YbjN domain-containing protein [Alicyclobacillus sp.]